jgi:hypothetical protein
VLLLLQLRGLAQLALVSAALAPRRYSRLPGGSRWVDEGGGK